MFSFALESITDSAALESYFGVAMEAHDGKFTVGDKVRYRLQKMAEGATTLWKKIAGFISSKWKALMGKFKKVKVSKKDKADYVSLKTKILKKIQLLPGLLTKIKASISSGKEMGNMPDEIVSVYSASLKESAARNTATEAAFDDGDRDYEDEDYTSGDAWEELPLAEETSFLQKMQAALKSIAGFLTSAAGTVANAPASPVHWLIKAAQTIISAVSAGFGKLNSIIGKGFSKENKSPNAKPKGKEKWVM